MAQMGYGYGSEYQLLRFLGHHRRELEEIISKEIGEGSFEWEDFEYANPLSVISGDKELMGLSFLERLYPSQYQSIKAEYESYGINNRNTWQNWDAIFIHNETLYLVEAKAHINELSSGNDEHGDKSKEEILRYLKEQLPDLPVSRAWLRKYYQMANRLATAALLNKNGVKTKVLYIYFVNGYRKRIIERVDKREKIYETVNLNSTEEEFKTAIQTEMVTLGINYNSVSSLLAKPVFVNAEPNYAK